METSSEKKWSAKDIAELGVMIAALEAGKLALSSLPNVEIVTFLIIMSKVLSYFQLFFFLPIQRI